MKAEMTQLKNVSENAAFISLLQAELNHAEQYNHQPYLEIQGMPVSTNEDLKKSFFDLTEKLAITSFEHSDMVAVHRLPRKNDKIPPICSGKLEHGERRKASSMFGFEMAGSLQSGKIKQPLCASAVNTILN